MADSGDSKIPSRLPTIGRRLPVPAVRAISKTGAHGPSGRGALTRSRSMSSPDLSVLPSKAAPTSTLSSRATSTRNLSKPPPNQNARSTATTALNRKRPAAAVSGSSTLHGGKRPLVQSNQNKPQARQPAAGGGASKPATSGATRKPAAWDTKGQLEVVRSKLQKLQQEKDELEGAAREAMELRQENSLRVSDLVRVEKDLREAREKLEESAHLASQKEELMKQVQHLNDDRRKLMDNLADLSQTLTGTNEKLTVTTAKVLQLEKDLEEKEEARVALEKKQQESAEEIQRLYDQVYADQQLRKKMHNQIQDLKGNIRVYCRIRPSLPSEASKQLCQLVCPDAESLEIKSAQDQAEASAHSSNRAKTSKLDFSYDRVFPPSSTQDDVYTELSQLVQSALDGYNVCVFAYGQTGSGKTHTMDGGDNENRGMIPRAVDTIFENIEELIKLGWKYTVQVSFMEIYNEQIRDLLDLNNNLPHDIRMVGPKSSDVQVTNVKVEVVLNALELHRLLAKAKKNRSVAATVCNEHSSRSHSVTKITLMGVNSNRNETCSGSLNLIDLAGSEKYNDGNVQDRKKETMNINKSLTNLGIVILSLSQKSSHVPYRNSKLTHLLMPCLGGNSKTLMMVNISPLEECYAESVNSLRFASKVNTCKVESAKRQVKSVL